MTAPQSHSSEPLQADLIHQAMDCRSITLLGDLDLNTETDSTNARLRRLLDSGTPLGSACLSDSQSDGRGRRGRHWVSPAGSNIYLSVAWRYAGSTDLSGLSLALGVAAGNALEDIGLIGTGLKWPNDLVWRGRKLGGILIEAFSNPSDTTVIAGIGINTHLPKQQAEDIDQPWTDIQRILGRPVSRNQLAGRLLHHLLTTLNHFADDGLSPWLHQYAERDTLAGHAVTLTLPNGSRTHGIARGIDLHGALMIEDDRGISSHPIGEASARADACARPNHGEQ